MKGLATFLLAVFSSSVALAQPGPIPGTQPVRPVFEHSDLVCMCLAEFVSIQRQQPPANADRDQRVRQDVTINLQPLEVYKTDETTQSITVKYAEDVPMLWPQVAMLQRGQMGLVFLKSTAPGIYDFSDRFLGVTLFSALPQKVEASGLAGLESALARIIQGTNRGDRLSALWLLQGYDHLSGETIVAVTSLTSPDDPAIALTSWAILLKAHAPESVQGLAHFLAGYRGDGEPTDALIGVEDGLSGVRDESSLSTLESLTDSKYMQVRQGAMQGVRGIGNPKSATVLVKRLDSSDPFVQYEAVITLSEIFRKYGDFGPSMLLFDRNPQKYVQLWKKWWEEERNKQ